MSELLLKSQNSSAAAQLICDTTTYYSSGIHCAYYSCIQFMKHTLYEKKGFDESLLDAEQEFSGKSIHVFLFQYFANYFMEEIDYEFSKSFREKCFALMRHRTSADYTQKKIDQTKLQAAISLSNFINKTVLNRVKVD
ncbi:MAG: hypothetical protein IPJ66_01335 [Bacteroidetes bacterium]|nr:hypothetical protein [Bacteroidota bacterium]MBL0064584.1 hypothetical protein [Bacteroidota bacterium]